MHRVLFTIVLLAVSLPVIQAQNALTPDQRIADLKQVSSLYAKNYAPYEWKRDVFAFDLLRLEPWLPQIREVEDLDFQEVLIDYVASLNDAHDLIAFPTLFSANLGFSVDIYDGKALIDSINRAALPADKYRFAVGDELVSLDRQPAQELIESFRKYAIAANPRSTDRIAALRIVSRSQQIMPHSFEIGDTALAVIRSFATGVPTTYEIPWRKIGTAITSQGPVPSPRARPSLALTPQGEAASVFEAPPTVFRSDNILAADNTLPSYMRPILLLLNVSVPHDYYAVLNFGGRFPIYNPPPGFVMRLGGQLQDFFFSGTYVANGVRMGLIRIPSMFPPNTALALQKLDQEIAYFNENTDGLIVDVMRNPGGSVSFVESLAQRFIPTPFRTMGFEIRATASWLYLFDAWLTSAELSNAPPWIVENLRNNYNEVLRAYNEHRGRSAPVSLNFTGSLTLAPAPVAYTKPLMVLTDEFSASGADMFPAIIQDNERGPIFGMRSMGAGGSVVGFDGTAYTESFVRITVSLMNRGTDILTPEFPPSPYIENIGVRPDITEDYMTRANLVTGGQAYVQAFTAAIVNLVQGNAKLVR